MQLPGLLTVLTTTFPWLHSYSLRVAAHCEGTTCHVHPERSSDGLPSSSSDLTNPYDTAFPMPLGQVPAFPFPLQFLGCFTLGSARTKQPLAEAGKGTALLCKLSSFLVPSKHLLT